MTPKARAKRRSPLRQTELRRTSREAVRRSERDAADRERRVYLTAKFDRTWSALTQLRAQVGSACFRNLMVDLPDALDEVGSPTLGAVAEFHDLLGGDDFRAFRAEVARGRRLTGDAFELKPDPVSVTVVLVHPGGEPASAV